MGLMSFFSYYGGKWRIAPKYPAPEHRVIIEPFSGAAGYATRHHAKGVILCDKNPIITGLWSYLIRVRVSEIARLPLEVEDTRTLKVCQEARWLIGFWLNKGTDHPCNTPSKWMRGGTRPMSYWSAMIRHRIACQVRQIRHWQVREGSYEILPDKEATWFIDPPYSGYAGNHYKCGIDNYQKLGDWCRSLKGQVIVCEAEGASWLPFSPFITARSSNNDGKNRWRKEVIWQNSSGQATV